jgi:hypothetical protein
MAGFCVECGGHVDSFDGLKCCPLCGSTSLPCADEEQVSVSINWHELRVLCMWAENWQRENDLGRTVFAIAKRLAAQHPDRASLTFAGEIGEIAKRYDVSVSDPALRRDIAEQTGEETGLA